MRLMKTKSTGELHRCPCSKLELITGIRSSPKWNSRLSAFYPILERCTRTHLVDIAGEVAVLIDLEQRSSIKKILKGAKIDFIASDPTYALVDLAVTKALEKYGVADLVSLGKNLKKSPLSRSE